MSNACLILVAHFSFLSWDGDMLMPSILMTTSTPKISKGIPHTSLRAEMASFPKHACTSLRVQ